MTFLGMRNLVYAGVKRDDLNASYGDFVNQAIREIENKRSWTQMKQTVEVTLLANTFTVNLPADFKEMQNVRPPVHQKLIAGGIDPLTGLPISVDQIVWRPVSVVYEHQEIHRIWSFGGLVGYIRMFLEKNPDGSGTSILGLEVPAISNLTFRVKYYRYLPNLVNDTDTSPFIDAYPQMVLDKAKEIAFDSINDPYADRMAERFTTKFMEAAMQDARSDVTGRAMHM